MRKSLLSSVLVLSCFVWLLGCGSEGGDDGGGGAGSSQAGSGEAGSGAAGTGTQGHTGRTPCGIGECQAGQYCWNGVCTNGCLSNDNCSSDQTCEDIQSDTSAGTCRNKAVAPTKDCKAFCDKAIACQDPEAALCMTACTGLSAECVACAIDSNCGQGCDEVCEL